MLNGRRNPTIDSYVAAVPAWTGQLGPGFPTFCGVRVDELERDELLAVFLYTVRNPGHTWEYRPGADFVRDPRTPRVSTPA